MGAPTIQVCLLHSLSHLLWAPLDTHGAQGCCACPQSRWAGADGLKISWKTGGRWRGRQQGEPHTEHREQWLLSVGTCVVPIHFSCPKPTSGQVCMENIKNPCPRPCHQQGQRWAVDSGSLAPALQCTEAAGTLLAPGMQQAQQTIDG